jgi:hypothetical protein
MLCKNAFEVIATGIIKIACKNEFEVIATGAVKRRIRPPSQAQQNYGATQTTPQLRGVPATELWCKQTNPVGAGPSVLFA